MSDPSAPSGANRRRTTESEREALWSARVRAADPVEEAPRRFPWSLFRRRALDAEDSPATPPAQTIWRDRAARPRRNREVGPPVGRLYVHLFVAIIVGSVVAVGGFRRPTDGLDVLLGTDPANLPLQTRLLLGPRVALIEPRDSLLRPATATTVNASPTIAASPADVVTYVVQAGDTVWDIGARLNVGMYSVLWSNDLNEDDVVRPGQELHIPPVPGVAYLVKPSDTLDGIAARFSVEPTTVVDANSLRPGEPLPADRWIVVPGGELPITVRPEAPIVRPAAPAARPIAPAPARPAPAPRPAAPAPAVPAAPVVATGRLQWPTRGSITTYFSGWHPGIDIAAPLGTPISVSDAGRVVYAGWDRTGYGNRIIVNHGNGFTTTYNHLSAFLVQVGQSVSKGQVIARMGSTGNSTGPHLHFEILRNGGYVNPLNALS